MHSVWNLSLKFAAQFFDCHWLKIAEQNRCFWCVHGDFLLCQLSPIVFVWRSESTFSCEFVCLRAVRHMTLPIKPLSIQTHWPIGSLHTAPIGQMAIWQRQRDIHMHIERQWHFLKLNDYEKIRYFWSHTALLAAIYKSARGKVHNTVDVNEEPK